MQRLVRRNCRAAPRGTRRARASTGWSAPTAPRSTKGLLVRGKGLLVGGGRAAFARVEFWCLVNSIFFKKKRRLDGIARDFTYNSDFYKKVRSLLEEARKQQINISRNTLTIYCLPMVVFAFSRCAVHHAQLHGVSHQPTGDHCQCVLHDAPGPQRPRLSCGVKRTNTFTTYYLHPLLLSAFD